MPENITVTLLPKTVAELEPVADETHETIESLVHAAIAEYLRLWKKRKLRELLAKQYEELAGMWAELAEDLAEENWLTVENESLLRFENTLAR